MDILENIFKNKLHRTIDLNSNKKLVYDYCFTYEEFYKLINLIQEDYQFKFNKTDLHNIYSKYYTITVRDIVSLTKYIEKLKFRVIAKNIDKTR